MTRSANLKGVAFYEVHVHRKENGPVRFPARVCGEEGQQDRPALPHGKRGKRHLSTERGRFTAEITIKNNGTFFRAHETTSDMYASVDSAVATIERQIRKNKTRLAKKLRDGAFEREVQPDFLPADDAAEAGAFEIVRRKRFPIKPMSVEEAILQMDLLEHTFFVFRDVAADGAVSVVYRRKDGGYGLISDATE